MSWEFMAVTLDMTTVLASCMLFFATGTAHLLEHDFTARSNSASKYTLNLGYNCS